MGYDLEQQRQIIKGMAFITGKQAHFVYGYLLQNFIDALGLGLVMYDNKGQALNKPLDTLVNEYKEQQLNILETNFIKNEQRIYYDIYSNRLPEHTRINQQYIRHAKHKHNKEQLETNAKELFLENSFYNQRQLTAIMETVINGERPKAKRGPKENKKGKAITEETANRIALTISELSPEEHLTKDKFCELVCKEINNIKLYVRKTAEQVYREKLAS